MLSLTKKTGYGLIAMAHLAELPEGRVASAREIAELYGIPTALLMNVLKDLAAAGYVESLRGSRGGYRLARRPEGVNLADLVAAIEGPVPQAECVAAVAMDEECTCAGDGPLPDGRSGPSRAAQAAGFLAEGDAGGDCRRTACLGPMEVEELDKQKGT